MHALLDFASFSSFFGPLLGEFEWVLVASPNVNVSIWNSQPKVVDKKKESDNMSCNYGNILFTYPASISWLWLFKHHICIFGGFLVPGS